MCRRAPNFDLRSLFVNFEVGVLVYTEPEISRITAWVEDVMKLCVVPAVRKRNLLASLAEELCGLLAPIL